MFVELCGISKSNSSVDYAMLEYCIREDLKGKAPRVMAVIDPIKLIIDNYPEDKVEYFDVVNNPENEEMGTRQVAFSRELYIDRDDFMEEPPKKYFRLFPGNEVRLYENIVDEEKGKLNEDGTLNLNPNSKTVMTNARIESSIRNSKAEDKYQFVRKGFFCVDSKDTTEDKLVFNETVSLKSSFKLPKN